MTGFVEQCRREWARLGVPEGEANEMASDLEADLAEARADGVSPEAVLGNGYFDARSFAASWATARGVVGQGPRVPGTIRTRSLVLALSALAGLLVAAVGFLILVPPRAGSVAVAAPLARHLGRMPPSIFVSPRGYFYGPGAGFDPLGWVLLVAGVVGLAVALGVGRPWTAFRKDSEPDQNVGMPSYL